MTDTMYCCVCRGNIADFYHAIHVHAMAYSLLLAYRHFSSLLSSVFLLSQNWFKKDLTIESLSITPPGCAGAASLSSTAQAPCRALRGACPAICRSTPAAGGRPAPGASSGTAAPGGARHSNPVHP